MPTQKERREGDATQGVKQCRQKERGEQQRHPKERCGKVATSQREEGWENRRKRAAAPRRSKGRQHHPKKAASLPSLGWCCFPSLLFRVVLLSPPPPPHVGAAVLPPSLGVVLLSSLGPAKTQQGGEREGRNKRVLNPKRQQEKTWTG